MTGRSKVASLACAVQAAMVVALVGCTSGQTAPTSTPTPTPTATAAPTAEPASEPPTTTPAALTPTTPNPAFTCVNELPGAQWLSGTTGDETVSGVVAGSGPTLVILGHQSDGNVCSWVPFAQELIAAGHSVALASFVPGDPVALLLGLADYGRAAGATGVVVMGASMGAAYAIGAAAPMEPPPDLLIALSPPLTYDPAGPAPEVDALEAASRIDAPFLLVVGERDGGFLQPAEEIADASDAEFVVDESGGHGIDLLDGAELRQRVLDAIAAA